MPKTVTELELELDALHRKYARLADRYADLEERHQKYVALMVERAKERRATALKPNVVFRTRLR